MSNVTDKLYAMIGDHPPGNKISTIVNVDDIMEAVLEIKRLEGDVYAYPPTDPYVPDGLTWRQLCAYKDQEKRGGKPINMYLKNLNDTSELLLEHHRQAIAAMAQVMQNKDMTYIESVWKAAMSAFMEMPENIIKGAGYVRQA